MDTETAGLRVAFLGSWEPYYTTENELRDAMERNGMRVDCYTERDIEQVDDLTALIAAGEGYDFVLWVSTKSARDAWGLDRQWKLIAMAKKAGVPLVAYHLDRWWDLSREDWLDDPYFKIDLVVTADGGHDDLWETKQINHRWLPPAISERWCKPGMWREEYACDVMFVGNWGAYGHTEWQHRYDLIAFLDKQYGQINRPGRRGLRLLPKLGLPAIRGLDLNDAYWSAKVVVGDSCLVPRRDGSPMTRYCSDRVPETLGRGGILIHPSVEGIDKLYGEQFVWELGDWAGLRDGIDLLIDAQDGAHESGWVRGSVSEHRLWQIEKIKAEHTYTVRIRQLVDIMREEGLL